MQTGDSHINLAVDATNNQSVYVLEPFCVGSVELLAGSAGLLATVLFVSGDVTPGCLYGCESQAYVASISYNVWDPSHTPLR
jgi:hypothetical protein